MGGVWGCARRWGGGVGAATPRSTSPPTSPKLLSPSEIWGDMANDEDPWMLGGFQEPVYARGCHHEGMYYPAEMPIPVVVDFPFGQEDNDVGGGLAPQCT